MSPNFAQSVEMKALSAPVRTFLLKAQRSELTEHLIYSRLARRCKDSNNAAVLQRIADEELAHSRVWQRYTGVEVKADRIKAFFYYWCAVILGLTFTIKLMEKGEQGAQIAYDRIAAELPEAKKIEQDEEAHEQSLIAMIDEERLSYIGSIVLGLNDALVELTGALAGLTFALQDSRLIATAGLITGIAASFSMAASEYLSHKAEGKGARSLKAAVYTGIAYIITVFSLITPYLIGGNLYVCLALTLGIAILIIFLFNIYLSVAKDLPFLRRFAEMAGLSLGVAAITFGIGVLVRTFWGIEV